MSQAAAESEEASEYREASRSRDRNDAVMVAAVFPRNAAAGGKGPCEKCEGNEGDEERK